MAELKPCPFCGAKAGDSTGTGGPELRIDEKGCHFVFCYGCGATGPEHAFFQTDAIPAWNRRASIGDTPAPQSKEAALKLAGVSGLVPDPDVVGVPGFDRGLGEDSKAQDAPKPATVGVPPSDGCSPADFAADQFCDGHCTWAEHHPDCPRALRYVVTVDADNSDAAVQAVRSVINALDRGSVQGVGGGPGFDYTIAGVAGTWRCTDCCGVGGCATCAGTGSLPAGVTTVDGEVNRGQTPTDGGESS